MNRFLENNIKLAQTCEKIYCNPSGIAKSIYFYLHGIGDCIVEEAMMVSQKKHCDHGYLILCSLTGHGILHYRQQAHTISPLSALFIDCSEPWYIKTEQKEAWHFLWVHFDGQSCLGYFRQYTRRHYYNLISLEETSPLTSSFYKLMELQQTPDSALECKTSQLLGDMLTEMILKNGMDDSINHVIPKYIHDAAFIIENEYDRQILLSEVAARVGVSIYYLSREFKSHTGKTFTNYLAWFRIEQAKKFLRESDLSVEQICYRCGMHTVSHFINTFRIHEGLTPLAYRKAWNAKSYYHPIEPL